MALNLFQDNSLTNWQQKLRKMWETYIHIPMHPDALKEKSMKLDIFLQKLVAAVNEMDEVPQFSDMASVRSLLAGEFLVDVHRICNDCQDDDVSPLQTYLLQGRGCLILQVLHTLGVQGMSCAKELAELLVSILPLCFKFHSRPLSLYNTDMILSSMDSCFSHLGLNSSRKKMPKFPVLSEVRSGNTQKPVPPSVPRGHPSLGWGGIFSNNWGRKWRQNKHSHRSSSEESEKEEFSHRTKQSVAAPTLMIGMEHAPVGVIPGLIKAQTSDDDGDGSQSFSHEEMQHQPNVTLDGRELCLLLLTLTKDLCHEDSKLMRSDARKYACISTLPQLVQLSVTLYKESTPQTTSYDDVTNGTERLLGDWPANDVQLVQRYLLRVTLTVASYVVLQPGGLGLIHLSSILTMLMDIAKTIIDLTVERSSVVSDIYSDKSPLLFATEILHGLLLLSHCLFIHMPLNLSALSSSLKFFNELFYGQGFKLVELVILLWEEHLSNCAESNSKEALMSREVLVGLLQTLSKIITTLKKSKINYIHAVKCSKRKHRQCDYNKFVHHHHDILGIAGKMVTDVNLAESNSYGSMEGLNTGHDKSMSARPECAISVLGKFSLTLFERSKSRLLQVRVLCLLEEAGLCCCLSPETVLASLLKDLSSHSTGLRTYILTVTTKLVLHQLGGAGKIQADRGLCAVCKDANAEDLVQSPYSGDVNSHTGSVRPETSDSAFSGSDMSLHEVSPSAPVVSSKSRWSCVGHYLGKLALGTEEYVGVQVMQHVLRLASQGSTALQQQLFSLVCLPLLQHTRQQLFTQSSPEPVQSDEKNTGIDYTHNHSNDTIIPDKDISSLVVHLCLNALPQLLQSTHAQEVFAQEDGIKKLCELVMVDTFRLCVLKVFQVLIVLNDRRLEGLLSASNLPAAWDPESSQRTLQGENEGEVTAGRDSGLYSDSFSLQSCISSPIRTRDVQQVFLQMLLAGGVDIFSSNSSSSHSQLNSQVIIPMDKLALNAILLNEEDTSQRSILCDLWSAAQGLFMQSRSFRQQFLAQGGSQLALDVLEESLQMLAKIASKGVTIPTVYHRSQTGTFSQCLSLIHASLNVCLAIAKLKLKFGTKDLECADVTGLVETTIDTSSLLTDKGREGIKAVCDMLLSVATATKNMPDLLQSHSFTLAHLRSGDDSMLYDRELQDLSDSSSARETETCYTEMGYEADSEFTPDEQEKGLRGKNRQAPNKHKTLKPIQTIIVHPCVCVLLLRLLAKCSENCESSSTRSALRHVLLKITSLTKQNSNSLEALYNEGLLTILLEGFKPVLYSQDENMEVERHMILDLFLVIAGYTISSKELSLFFQYFNQCQSHGNHLLTCLLSLTESHHNKPSHSLSFPVVKCSLITDLEVSQCCHSSAFLSASICPITTSLDECNEYSALLQSNDAREALDYENTIGSIDSDAAPNDDLQSPMNIAPLQMTLHDHLMWPTNQKGFGLAWWMWMSGDEETINIVDNESVKNLIKLEPKFQAFFHNSGRDKSSTHRSRNTPNRKPRATRHWSQSCLHVVSIGCPYLRFEVWINPDHKNFVFRLVSKKGNTEIVLNETSIPCQLQTNKWHHVTLSYMERVQTRLTGVNLTLVIDGCYQRDATLEYNANCVPGDTGSDSRLYLGHALPTHQFETCPTTWQMGNLMLFKDSLLTKHWSFHLYALGPTCCSLGQCDCSDQTAEYAHYITEGTVQYSGLSHDVFTGNHKIYQQHMRENLVLVYSPHNPGFFNLYSQPVALKSQNIGIRNILPSNSNTKTVFNPLCQQPTAVLVRLVTDVAALEHVGFPSSIKEIGGIGVLMFLFAKSVEQDLSEVQQAIALRILLTQTKRHPDHNREFINMGGYDMVNKVLCSSHCIIGYHMLKVILDACTSQPVILESATSGRHYLEHDTSALIQNVTMVTQVLLCWRVWERASTMVWQMGLQSLDLLIRESHPSRAFNMRQLYNGDIVNKILTICQERIQDGFPSLPVPLCQSMLNVIRSLVGHPADIHLLVTICDFLLLTHPAASTFVFHSPDSFYFRHKWTKLGQSTFVDSHQSSSSTPSITSTPIKKYAEGTNLRDRKLQQYSSTFDENAEKENKPPEKTSGKIKRSHSLPNCLSPELGQTDHKIADAEFYEDNLSSSRAQTYPTNSDDVCLYNENKILGIEGGIKTSNQINSIRKISHGSFEVLNYNSNVDNSIAKESSRFLSDEHVANNRNSSPDVGDLLGGTNENLRLSIHQTKSIPGHYVEDGKHRHHSEASSEGFGAHSTPLSSKMWDIIEEGEEGLVYISSGLLKLLSQAILELPDPELSKVLGVIVKPEDLIVWMHHSSVSVRTAALEMLDIYFHRASKEQLDNFLGCHGYHQLANQLHQHEAKLEVAQMLFTIMIGTPHELEDDLDLGLLLDMPPIRQYAVVPILALLENSVKDIPLCHNMICLLIQLYDGLDQMAIVMMENGLVETLCNVVSSVNTTPYRPSDTGGDTHQLLLEDIQHFFCVISEKTFSLSGVQHYQQLEDCFNLLHCLQLKHIQMFGDSEEVAAIRHIQCHMLQAILDYISGRLDPSSDSHLKTSTITAAVGSLLRRLSISSESDTPGNGRRARQSHAHSLPTGVLPGNLGRHLNTGKQWEEPGMWSVITRSMSLDPSLRKNLATPGSRSTDTFSHVGLLGIRKTSLSQNELIDRMKKITVHAVDTVIFMGFGKVLMKGSDESRLEARIERETEQLEESGIEVVSAEHAFTRSLLEFLVKAVITGMDRSFFQRKSMQTVMWSAKDVFRIQLARLLANSLSSEQDLPQRLHALSLITNEPRCREVLRLVAHIRNTGSKLVQYTYQLLQRHSSELGRYQRDEAEELMIALQECGFLPMRLGSKITTEQKESIQQEKKNWEQEKQKEVVSWNKRKEGIIQRVLRRMEPLAKKVSGYAMESTQQVNYAQNSQRKKFLLHVKQEMANRLQTKKAWQQLIQQLTHERAVWHCKKSHPPSWQVDPTEGPCRVRRRLQPCHLDMESRFVHSEHKDKLSALNYDPPLSFLFEEDGQGSDSAAIIYKLHTNENIQHTCMCTNVTPSSETNGELLIGLNNIYFVADKAIMDANYTQVLLGNRDLLFITLPHTEVKELHKRRYQLCDNALEIFLTNGKTTLMAFENKTERDKLYNDLHALDLPNLILGENLLAIQQLWVEGRMPNFEYLTHLNKMAGRSFNDLMQYPVMPFILATYDKTHLSFDDPKTFRDLGKPIAVQHKDKAQKYLDNYKWLEAEKKRHRSGEEADQYQPEPYHYGSHYSNSGTVLHFLVRLPPFTQMFLSYQDQSFDLPDRTFHSLQTSWRLASRESTTDVKELIPEFFFLPEFFMNAEGFNFGRRQTGEQVWDVTMPDWCRRDARLFILVHRQILESAHVNRHLAQWIDLVFGFKQTGRLAIEAINVFHPSTYFGVDVNAIRDPMRRNATKTMIRTYGQTPKQLFKSLHPNPTKNTKGKVNDTLSPLPNVTGLRWGDYVGSPDYGDPMPVWTQTHASRVASLVALPTGEVFGLGPDNCLLVMYSKEKGVTAVNTVDVLWASIVSWNHPDQLIRIKNRKNQPAFNFLHWDSHGQVTCCASVPDCRLLFFGSTTGVLSVYKTEFNPSKVSHMQVFGHRQSLYGHNGPISDVKVCKPYSVVVTSSHDKTCIIWDLNKLVYVRSIRDHHDRVHTVCISDTSADIASVSHTERGSCVMLHTVNGQHIATVECEKLVFSLTFSTAPEGRSVNVLAAGLSNGTIRLWSSWDLLLVRDITWDSFTRPVVSLTFSPDNQRLFAATSDGQVAVWEKPPLSRPGNVVFIPFL